jgi:hypothetical protein
LIDLKNKIKQSVLSSLRFHLSQLAAFKAELGKGEWCYDSLSTFRFINSNENISIFYKYRRTK